MTSIQIDKSKPQVIDSKIQFSEVTDFLAIIQVGPDGPPYKLWDVTINPSRLGTTKAYSPDDWTVAKFQVQLNPNQIIISRGAYSLLNLIGDCGGLETALAWMGAKIVAFFISFYATAEIIMLMYWKRPPSNKLPDDITKSKTTGEIKEEMIREFNQRQDIKPPNPFAYILGYCFKRSRYGKQLRFQSRATEKLTKELDICRIIKQ